jgi:hypothetical protein
MDLYALNPRMLRLLSTGSAIGLVVMMCAGMLMAGLLPPPGPDMPAADLARFLAENAAVKRTGMLVMMVGIALYGTWCAVITLWIRRAEEGRFPVLAWASAILWRLWNLRLRDRPAHLGSRSIPAHGDRPGDHAGDLRLRLVRVPLQLADVLPVVLPDRCGDLP